jgi:membrane-associated phospholipid phosphatase
VRLSEWVLAVYFSWTTVLSIWLPVVPQIRARTLIVNIGVLLLYVILLRFRRDPWTGYLRDWVPLALMILAYKQMGWFAPASHAYTLEHQWIVWDRFILDDLHGRAFIELLGPVMPAILEIAYSFVYAVPPLTMGVLYATGHKNRSDTLLTIYLLGLFLCYAQFPFWPSEPPRTVFAGQDLPNIHTVFRDFNLWLVGSYGIHTSVFPSAHVSGAFAAFCAVAHLIPQRSMLKLAYFVYATLVAIATVYGRYHYAVDAVAGFFIGVAALPLGLWLLSLYYRNSGASVQKDRERTAEFFTTNGGSTR